MTKDKRTKNIKWTKWNREHHLVVNQAVMLFFFFFAAAIWNTLLRVSIRLVWRDCWSLSKCSRKLLLGILNWWHLYWKKRGYGLLCGSRKKTPDVLLQEINVKKICSIQYMKSHGNFLLFKVFCIRAISSYFFFYWLRGWIVIEDFSSHTFALFSLCSCHIICMLYCLFFFLMLLWI